MKALTIKQPWIHAILREGKDIVNRTWKRDFRGWTQAFLMKVIMRSTLWCAIALGM
jgi:hypothetical protein